MNIEEEDTGRQQVSLQLIGGHASSSVSGRFQSEPSYSVVTRVKVIIRGITESIKSFNSIVTKSWLFHLGEIAAECFYLQRPTGNSIYLILCMISMLTDPFFLYIPVINNEEKCFELDMELGILAILERSVCDFSYVASIFSPLSPFSLVDLFAILPLPQVLVILVINKKIRGTNFFFAMNFFLFQHMLKIIRLYSLFRKAKTLGNVAGWAKVAFNLSYFHAAHVIGASWYFFAVERQTLCWRKAYINDTQCSHHLSVYCHSDGSENYTFSDDFCSKEIINSTDYDFGIFRDAIQSGVVEANIIQRFVSCFRWGVQNLSSFGQGIPFSANIFENLFVTSITISSVVFFFFLIGKVQMYVQSETIKLEEIREKVREIEWWLPFGKLPKELQKQLKRCKSYRVKESRGIDVEYLLDNLLDKDLKSKIKRHLCLDLLTKVEGFGNWSDKSLEDLCNLVKPIFYTERSYIIREGNPICQMLFILQGKLWTYTSRAVSGSSSTYNRNKNKNHLEDGDYFGEELITWAAQADPDSFNLPNSSSNIQALTNVEAFVLQAIDLKSFITDHQA